MKSFMNKYSIVEARMEKVSDEARIEVHTRQNKLDGMRAVDYCICTTDRTQISPSSTGNYVKDTMDWPGLTERRTSSSIKHRNYTIPSNNEPKLKT